MIHDEHSMGKRRRRGKVKEIAEAIKRKHTGIDAEPAFKMANETVSKMKRKRR
jgi:hypothetical protein